MNQPVFVCFYAVALAKNFDEKHIACCAIIIIIIIIIIKNVLI